MQMVKGGLKGGTSKQRVVVPSLVSTATTRSATRSTRSTTTNKFL